MFCILQRKNLMKSLFKFLFYTIGITLVCIVSIIGIACIDQNNLMDAVMENAPLKATALVSTGFKEAKMSFAMPHDSRPLVVDISEKNSNDIEYQYIYPSQIFYASSGDIKLLFRDSIFTISNNLGLKSMKQRLQSSHGAAFLYTQSYAINRAAIIGVLRLGQQSYNYRYLIRLINGEELSISKNDYKTMTKNIELAKPDYSF